MQNYLPMTKMKQNIVPFDTIEPDHRNNRITAIDIIGINRRIKQEYQNSPSKIDLTINSKEAEYPNSFITGIKFHGDLINIVVESENKVPSAAVKQIYITPMYTDEFNITYNLMKNTDKVYSKRGVTLDKDKDNWINDLYEYNTIDRTVRVCYTIDTDEMYEKYPELLQDKKTCIKFLLETCKNANQAMIDSYSILINNYAKVFNNFTEEIINKMNEEAIIHDKDGFKSAEYEINEYMKTIIETMINRDGYLYGVSLYPENSKGIFDIIQDKDFMRAHNLNIGRYKVRTIKLGKAQTKTLKKKLPKWIE